MSTIQVAILAPALLLWLMLIVQYGLWWHAKQMANAAAAEAVDVAQVPDGTAATGEASARSFLHQAGNLTNVTVAVERSAGIVTVEVRGSAPQLVPMLSWRVVTRSQAPVERYVPAPDR
jgi:Flp pilus assembly protein TadG